MKIGVVQFRIRRMRLLCCMAIGAAAFASLWLGYHSLKIAVALAALFVCAAFVEVHLENCKTHWLVALGMGLVTGIACTVCAQSFTAISSLAVMLRNGWALPLNILCYSSIYAAAYVASRRAKLSAVIATALAVVAAVINCYVYEYRGTVFQLRDILAVKTAAAVAKQYTLFINERLLTGFFLTGAWLVWLLWGVRLPQRPEKVRFGRGISFGMAVLCLALSAWGCAGIKGFAFQDQGLFYNGLAGNLLGNLIQSLSYKAPEGYNDFDWVALENTVTKETDADKKPHVIVVMAEAWSDLRIYSGQLNTNQPVMPFYDSLEENTIKGYSLTSVFGGTTANSEYEFLTGNTMGFFPSGTVPFQQYVEPGDYSLVTHMKNLGYETVAMHPEIPTNWKRSEAWSAFGFDETFFLEDFPREDIVHAGVSDQEFVEQVLLQLKERRDGPMFLFGVTMQNHSGYREEGREATVRLEGYDGSYPDVEQYLSLLRISDDALKYLITELSQLEEETVLLYFGDHQPNVSVGCIEELNGGPMASLAESQKRYTVPFLIWANYDIPEKTVSLTSLNYLSGYLMEAAGIPAAPYQQYLQALEQEIPATNAFGFLSANGTFSAYEDAAGQEAKALQTYRILQYNAVGARDRNPVFFPQAQEDTGKN